MKFLIVLFALIAAVFAAPQFYPGGGFGGGGFGGSAAQAGKSNFRNMKFFSESSELQVEIF